MLEVSTGSRLHFGLMELAEGESLRFGGLGLMLEEPRWRLRFTLADNPCPSRDSHSRADNSANEIDSRIDQILNANRSVASVQVETLETLPLHRGLGSGTQLASAVVAGQLLCRQASNDTIQTAEDWLSVRQSIPDLSVHELARLSGRGLRSAVGLQGFLTGGLILDEGYQPGGESRTITARSAALPDDWRVVLLCPATDVSVSGDKEASLLAEIARSPNPNRRQMFELAADVLNCLSEDVGRRQRSASELFETVVTKLEQYMLLAAKVFELQQGGLYNGEAIARAVVQARQAGLRGVGQSSWGPTVFGFAPNPAVALDCMRKLRQSGTQLVTSVVKPAAQGARWRVSKPEHR